MLRHDQFRVDDNDTIPALLDFPLHGQLIYLQDRAVELTLKVSSFAFSALTASAIVFWAIGYCPGSKQSSTLLCHPILPFIP